MFMYICSFCNVATFTKDERHGVYRAWWGDEYSICHGCGIDASKSIEDEKKDCIVCTAVEMCGETILDDTKHGLCREHEDTFAGIADLKPRQVADAGYANARETEEDQFHERMARLGRRANKIPDDKCWVNSMLE